MKIKLLKSRACRHCHQVRGSECTPLLADDRSHGPRAPGHNGCVSERGNRARRSRRSDLAETDNMRQAPVVADEDGVIQDAIARMNELGICHVVAKWVGT